MIELNETTRKILGRPNFMCMELAKALRLKGHDIAEKSEDEQAAVIHWLLCLYEEYGEDFGKKASEYLDDIIKEPTK
jgi:hypothetical protein